MKKIIFLLITVLASAVCSYAQYKITVTETTENFGVTSHNAFSVTIYQQKIKDVQKEWSAYMKDQRGKVKSKKGLFTAHNVALYQISSDTVNAYARFKDAGEGQIIANIGFESGDSFVSSAENDTRYEPAHKIVYDFAVRMTKEGVLENIKDTERELKNLERDTKILEKDKTRLEYNIEKSKATITKSKESIIKKTKKIEENKIKLSKKSQRVSELNESLKSIE